MSVPEAGLDSPQVAALVARLGRLPLLPVLRVPTADEGFAAAARCIESRLDTIELTTTTPSWPAVLTAVRRHYPEAWVGVGTVLSADDARSALDVGADFLVTPYPVASVRTMVPPDVPLIEGGMTVQEIMDAATHGIAKLFPAHVGGPSFLRSVLAIAPGIRVVPTGGISIDDVPTWLAAGALAVGVGADLVHHPDLTGAVQRLLARSSPPE